MTLDVSCTQCDTYGGGDKTAAARKALDEGVNVCPPVAPTKDGAGPAEEAAPAPAREAPARETPKVATRRALLKGLRDGRLVEKMEADTQQAVDGQPVE